MPDKNDCWGIEVGANAIKAVRLTRKGAEVTLEDFDVLPFKKVLTTPDLNVAEQIQVNLDLFMSNHPNIAKSTVLVSVPGHMAFSRFAKLPPVDPKRIPDIVRFEAQQQIPFAIEDVEWDYQVFAREDSPDVEVGIFAITKDRISEFLENYNAVGMRVDGVSFSPVAVYNAMAYDLELGDESTGHVIMDIGTTATDVIIVDEGRLWTRTLPIGGNNFTEALVRSFKLSFPKAEDLKRKASTSKYARQIFTAMRPVFADMVQEMQRSIGFYQSINRDAQLDKLVGIGSTFKLPGLSKFLKQQLQLDVVRPTEFERVEIDGRREAEFADHALNMFTAYGLALQGLELEQVSANVLPLQITKKRIWKAKQPWFGAAAALMLAATIGAQASLSKVTSSYEGIRKDTQNKVDATIRDADTLAGQYNDLKGKLPQQQMMNLRNLFDYRTVWPHILEDLNAAIDSMEPQPELQTNSYDQIKQIPRSDRRRVYIDSVTSEFRGVRATTTSAAFKTDLASNKFTGPSFTITVEAWTPMGDAPRFIDQFKRWFVNHALRRAELPESTITLASDGKPAPFLPDRPYLIDPASIQMSITPGGAPIGAARSTVRRPTSASDFGAARNDPRASRNDARGGRGDFRGGRSEFDSAAPPSSRGRGTALDDSEEQSAWDKLNLASDFLPRHPVKDEAKVTDWRFTFSYRVVLLTPATAREADERFTNDIEGVPMAPPEDATDETPIIPAANLSGADAASTEDRI